MDLEQELLTLKVLEGDDGHQVSQALQLDEPRSRAATRAAGDEVGLLAMIGAAGSFISVQHMASAVSAQRWGGHVGPTKGSGSKAEDAGVEVGAVTITDDGTDPHSTDRGALRAHAVEAEAQRGARQVDGDGLTAPLRLDPMDDAQVILAQVTAERRSDILLFNEVEGQLHHTLSAASLQLSSLLSLAR